MKATTMNDFVIAPHRFAFGFYRQTWWNWLIGLAFFFGEIGAGLFLASLLTHHWLGMMVGYLIVMVGKNTAHLLYLGRPARFWRAAMRPDRSWIARGIWGTGIFGATGLVVLFPHLFGLSQTVMSTLSFLAGFSALFIMFYDGFVMKASRSIPFWHTTFLPLLCLTYAALGGATLALTIRELRGEAIPAFLSATEYFLLVFNLFLLGLYLFRVSKTQPAARESVRLLLRGAYAFAFIGLVLLIGLLGTLLFSMIHAWTHWTWMVILVATCELTGDFALLMVLLKSGLFSPQTPPVYQSWARMSQ